MKNIFLMLLVFAIFQTAIFSTGGTADDVNPAALKDASFTVSARVYYGDEDEELVPVSASFYLLRRSVVDVLKSKNFQPVDERDKPLAGESDYLEAFASAVNDPGDESQLLALLIQNAISENQLTTIKTDRLGFGKSNTFVSGSYYLFGYARINDEIFVWNFPVTLSAGRRNRVEIDQHNAEVVLSVE